MMGIIGGALIFAMAALGLNLLLGYSGLISLGTAGFMGLGAYISAYVTVDLQLPWELGIILAIAIPAVFGVLIGFCITAYVRTLSRYCDTLCFGNTA